MTNACWMEPQPAKPPLFGHEGERVDRTTPSHPSPSASLRGGRRPTRQSPWEVSGSGDCHVTSFLAMTTAGWIKRRTTKPPAFCTKSASANHVPLRYPTTSASLRGGRRPTWQSPWAVSGSGDCHVTSFLNIVNRCMRKYHVYMIANKHNTVLYTGVTSALEKRVNQHKWKWYPGFTSKYQVNRLVYVEEFQSILDAIDREKQIKSWSRRRKEELIEKSNPEWLDLTEENA